MKWRLREGQGEAIYEIGVEDNGVMAGLADYEMDASLQTLEQMAFKLGATTTVLRERILDNGNGRKVAEVLVRKIPDDQHNIEVRVAVMGSADAGKSTLLGVLTQGQLDNGRGRARLNMFRHLHEVNSGRTSSISHEILGFNNQGKVVNYSQLITAEEICESSTKLVTFIDLAGHRKYLRTTILGLTGYSPHHVMLVVSSSAGVLGMTHEHLAIAMALDVPFFIVITKTDRTSPHDTLHSLDNMLKSVGCRKVPLIVTNEDDVITAGSNQLSENIVPIFCVSSVNGKGLELLTKFLHVLPPGVSLKERERMEQELCEFQIDETFRVPEIGTVIGGLLTKGVISEGSSLVIGPLDDGKFLPVLVQSMHRNKVPCRVVRASQSASLGLNKCVPGLRAGMVLLSTNGEPTGCFFFQVSQKLGSLDLLCWELETGVLIGYEYSEELVTNSLENMDCGAVQAVEGVGGAAYASGGKATICVLYHTTAIYPGFQTTVHIGNIRQTAVIEGIMATGGIHTNDQASALFRFVRHPEYVKEGMRLLFREGRTKGIGKITQVFPIQPP
uniref:Tr-type G domain-containing protein n=1 Tax=Timema cristinae TaxID=61476 RepID=A0A7R9H1G0_TIMCR|nr:unnamed protein product [Timema cristinae]